MKPNPGKNSQNRTVAIALRGFPEESRPWSFISHFIIFSAFCAILIFLSGCSAELNMASSSEPRKSNCTTSDNPSSDQLFSDVKPSELQPLQIRQESNKTLRWRMVKVNTEFLKKKIREEKARLIELNLFEKESLSMMIEQVEDLAEENLIVTGYLDDDPSSAVTLVMSGDVIQANIHTNESHRHFEVRYEASGVHVIREAGEEVIDECLTVEAGDNVAGFDSESQELLSPLSTPMIDVLAAYTPAAREYKGGSDAIRALIQMGAADTNQAFAASGANLKIRLVGIMEVRQNESSDYSNDLSALKSNGDGKWDEVHAERKRLGADQVSLIGAYGANSSVAGIGYIGSSSSTAFAITKAASFGRYTFSHELGHNIGLNHSDGLENTAGRFRTIMAYGTYPRIRRYSNPSLLYDGYSTGTETKNSVRIINSNAVRMAGLVPTAVPLPTPIPTATPAPPSSSPTPDPSPTPSSTPFVPGTEICNS